MDEVDEGQRELAFYTQALAAVKSAQAGLDPRAVPHTRSPRAHHALATAPTRPHTLVVAYTQPYTL